MDDYELSFKPVPLSANCISRLIIKDKEFFSKKYEDQIDLIQPIASSHLFDKIGVLSPPIYPVKMKNSSPYFYLFTEDVTELASFDECMLAMDAYIAMSSDIFGMAMEEFTLSQSPKWQFLYNKELKSILLEYMTVGCYNQTINKFLIDELRTETDAHDANYFYYKLKGSDKYNGIITMDFDFIEIINNNIKTKEDFSAFLKEPYQTYMPFSCLSDEDYYLSRIVYIRQLIQRGKLNKTNIKALISALEFDFAEDIKTIGKKFNLSQKQIAEIYDPIALLWEYNQKTLGKDLGM